MEITTSETGKKAKEVASGNWLISKERSMKANGSIVNIWALEKFI